MERPGLIEFVFYALLLSATTVWVYGLPPFEREPGSLRSASAQRDLPAPPSSDARSDGSELTPTIVRQTSTEADQPEASLRAGTAPAAADQPGSEAPRNLLVVTARNLNMRAEPNSRSALVGSYPRGALVEQVETSGNWVRVRTADQETGWMYIGYLGTAGN